MPLMHNVVSPSAQAVARGSRSQPSAWSGATSQTNEVHTTLVPARRKRLISSIAAMGRVPPGRCRPCSCAVIALITDHLGGSLRPSGFISVAGNRVERRARAADHGRSGAQQFVRDADADTSAGARDDRDLSGECIRHDRE